MADGDDLIQRVKDAWESPRVSAVQMANFVPELFREVKAWRAVAERVDAETPDELDTAISILGSGIQIGPYGEWGAETLECLFAAIGIQPGDRYGEALGRIGQ